MSSPPGTLKPSRMPQVSSQSERMQRTSLAIFNPPFLEHVRSVWMVIRPSINLNPVRPEESHVLVSRDINLVIFVDTLQVHVARAGIRVGRVGMHEHRDIDVDSPDLRG